MLRIYISCAPSDQKYLNELLTWLKPMQDKYYLYIWYNRKEPYPVLPFPWNVLFFWYSPKSSRLPYHSKLEEESKQGHIYLFLTSQKTLSVPWINEIEIPNAVERYREYGTKYIRIHPILVSASQWKNESTLAGFSPLGPIGKTMNQVKPDEDGWLLVVDQLRTEIEDLRRNWIEETKRIGDPIESFNKPAPLSIDEPQKIVPFPIWVGWLIIILLGWSLVRYIDSLRPKHENYYPKIELKEREYPRSPIPNTEGDVVVPRDSDAIKEKRLKYIEER